MSIHPKHSTKGSSMKKVVSLVGGLMLLSVSGALAQGTTVEKGSTVTNVGAVSGSANIATGNNVANQGSIRLKDTKIKEGAAVTNVGVVSNSANIAVGENAKANQASTDITGGSVAGQTTNVGIVSDSVNVAGENADANQGSIQIK